MKTSKIGTNFPTFNAFIISLAIYIALLGFIVYKAGFAIKQAQKYTDTKDAFMDVLIVTEERADTIMAPKAEIKKPEPAPEPPKPEPIKEEPKEEQITTNKAVEPEPEPVQPEPVKEPEPEVINMGDLFKDLNVSKPKPQAKPKAVQSNKKSAKENKSAKQKASEAINALQTSDKVRAPKDGLTGEYDEFKGAITRIIQQRWQKYSANTNDSVQVRIIFGANGKIISYSFVTRSYDAEFQSKARDLLENLKTVNFPSTPSGQREEMVFNLSDEIEIEME